MTYKEMKDHQQAEINACGLTVEQLNANPALIKGLKKAADDQRDEQKTIARGRGAEKHPPFFMPVKDNF